MGIIHRILVVDDDLDLCTIIGEQLEAAGGFVAETATTIQAAEHAVSVSSDVAAILLDVSLPDGDGRDLCARLRHNRVNVPVIMISGLTDEDDVVHALELGADAYMPKPFAASELIARLRNLLPRNLHDRTE